MLYAFRSGFTELDEARTVEIVVVQQSDVAVKRTRGRDSDRVHERCKGSKQSQRQRGEEYHGEASTSTVSKEFTATVE